MCGFPDCTSELVSDQGVVIGEIAHIEAEKPGGPRYNENQSGEERIEYGNLILFCPTHHTLIDKDSSTYTVQVLKKFKKKV